MEDVKKIVSVLLLTCMAVYVSTAYAEYQRDGSNTYTADNETEFGAQDDFVALGTNGTWSDPDVEIYGFSIFGSTVGITPKISASTGSVFIGGNLQVNSTAYIEGVEINQNAGTSKLIFNGAGTYSGRVLTLDAQGRVVFSDPSSIGAGDNLGNHIATRSLDMAGYEIINIKELKIGQGLSISSNTSEFGGVGAGILIATHTQINGQLYIGGISTFNAAAVFNAGATFSNTINIPQASYLKFTDGSTDQILIRNADGTMRWGTVSSLAQGDSLGNHIATKTLDMAGYNITRVSKIDFGDANLYLSTNSAYFGGIGAGVYISTNIEVAGAIKAQNFYGNASGLTGVATLTNTTAWRILRVDNSQQVVDAGMYQVGSDGITVDASSFTVVNASLFKAQVDMEGALNVKGNVSLGDQSTDTLTIAPLAATLSSVSSGQKYEYKDSANQTIAFFRKK